MILAVSREVRGNREMNCVSGINLSPWVKRQFVSPGNEELV